MQKTALPFSQAWSRWFFLSLDRLIHQHRIKIELKQSRFY